MEALLLAGGKAERLGEAAQGLPKPLVPVAGFPLAEYTVARLAEGVEVRAWDPVATPELQGVRLCATPLEAITGADAAVIVTEWPELLELATEEARAAMRHPLIVDGRNLLDPAAVRAAGFAYEGIGRAVSPTDVLPETPEREPETSE